MAGRVRAGRVRAGLRAAADRDAAVIGGTLLLLGVLCGVLWSLVVTPAEFTRLADGAAMNEDQLALKFGADGWYAAIAAGAGLLAGLALTWSRCRDALVTSAALLAGSVVAAAAMAQVGHLLGPGDPRAPLAAAKVGALVPERLDVGTFVVYLAWPLGLLAGALAVLLGRPGESGPPESEPDARAATTMLVGPRPRGIR